MRPHLFLCLFLLAPAASAQGAPSYAKQIGPFFARYCVKCHPAMDPRQTRRRNAQRFAISKR
jgi:hypothetical protein